MIRIAVGTSLQLVSYPFQGLGFAMWGDGIASPVAMLLSPISLPLIGLGVGLDFAGLMVQASGEYAIERWRRW